MQWLIGTINPSTESSADFSQVPLNSRKFENFYKILVWAKGRRMEGGGKERKNPLICSGSAAHQLFGL